MTRAILALLLLASLAAPALAQQRVEIAADLFTVEEASHEAIFTGNVLVEHPSVTVWADRVVATYGEGGTTDIRTFVATGQYNSPDAPRSLLVLFSVMVRLRGRLSSMRVIPTAWLGGGGMVHEDGGASTC